MNLQLSSLKQRVIAGAVGLAVVGSVLAPIGAHAQDNGPSGVPGKSCAVENENGTVTQVPVGTRVGLAYCGRDGEWHMGWLVDELTVGPSGGSHVPPVSRVPVSVRAQ